MVAPVLSFPGPFSDQLPATVGSNCAVTPACGVVPVTTIALLAVVSATPPPVATGEDRLMFSKLRSTAPQPFPNPAAYVDNAFPVPVPEHAAIAANPAVGESAAKPSISAVPSIGLLFFLFKISLG